MNDFSQISRTEALLEIIAFRLREQEFCVRTTTIREIRGWGPATPLPHTPPEVDGVMNLRGVVIPIIDLARKLGMPSAEPTERSAIVVAEANGLVFGLVVDGVSDILTLPATVLQPVPAVSTSPGLTHAEGIIAHDGKMICFLNLARMFQGNEAALLAA
jgi:purine-binding chemotaxis protein CheW